MRIFKSLRCQLRAHHQIGERCACPFDLVRKSLCGTPQFQNALVVESRSTVSGPMVNGRRQKLTEKLTKSWSGAPLSSARAAETLAEQAMRRIMATRARAPQTPRQVAMGKAGTTVLDEVLATLVALGVEIDVRTGTA